MGNTSSRKKRRYHLESSKTLPTPCSNRTANQSSSSLPTPIPCIYEHEETPNASRTSQHAPVSYLSVVNEVPNTTIHASQQTFLPCITEADEIPDGSNTPQNSATSIIEDVGVGNYTAVPLNATDDVDGVRDEDAGYVNLPDFSNDERRSLEEEQSFIGDEIQIECLQRGQTARSSKTSSSSKTTDSGNSSQPSDDYLTLWDRNVNTKRKCPVRCLQHRIRRKMKNQCDIKFMVDVYKELIVKTVRVKEILASLHHVIDDARFSEIQELQEIKSNKELMTLLLQTIEDSQVPGKWQAFIDALNEHEYMFLVQLLLHKTEDDQHQHRTLLKVLSPTMLGNISINECLDTLYSKGIISEEEKDRIERLDKNCGPIEATREIIKVVPRRSPSWIKEFAEVLKDNFMTSVAELFYIPEEEIQGDCSTDCPANFPTVDNSSAALKSKQSPFTFPDDTYNNHEIHGDYHGNGVYEMMGNLAKIQYHVEKQTEMIEKMNCTLDRHSFEIQEMRDSHEQLSTNARLDGIESQMKDFNSAQNKIHSMERYVKEIHQMLSPPSNHQTPPPSCGRITGSDSGIVFDGSGSGVALRPQFPSEANLTSTHL